MVRNPQILSLFKGAAVHLAWDITQRVDEDGTVWIGGRAGPKRCITNLCHEMAHFVEIDDARCWMRGWGLQVPQVEIFGQLCAQPETRQGAERECRVAAYQHNLLEWAGVYRTPKYLVSAFHFLPDFLFVPGKGDTARLRWCEELVHSLIKEPAYSAEAVIIEWWRKNQLLDSRQCNPSS